MMQHKVLSTKLLAGFFFCGGVLVSVHGNGRGRRDCARCEEAWKADDFIYVQTAGQFRISPDAKWVVWVKTTGDKEKDLRVTNLVLSSLTESREIPLTRGSDNNTQPRWSPDGEWIAFTSTRARPKPKPDTAPMQIWLINAHGGEPWALTELAHPRNAWSGSIMTR